MSCDLCRNAQPNSTCLLVRPQYHTLKYAVAQVDYMKERAKVWNVLYIVHMFSVVLCMCVWGGDAPWENRVGGRARVIVCVCERASVMQAFS